MSVIVHCFDKTLFSSTLMLDFVYVMMIFMYGHTQNRHTGKEER